MISQDKMEQALDFLARTDTEYAHARGDLADLKRKKEVVFAMAFAGMSPQGSVAAREYEATRSAAYRQHLDKITHVEKRCYALQNERESAVWTIEVWRSETSARGKGVIT